MLYRTAKAIETLIGEDKDKLRIIDDGRGLFVLEGGMKTLQDNYANIQIASNAPVSRIERERAFFDMFIKSPNFLLEECQVGYLVRGTAGYDNPNIKRTDGLPVSRSILVETDPHITTEPGIERSKTPLSVARFVTNDGVFEVHAHALARYIERSVERGSETSEIGKFIAELYQSIEDAEVVFAKDEEYMKNNGWLFKVDDRKNNTGKIVVTALHEDIGITRKGKKVPLEQRV